MANIPVPQVVARLVDNASLLTPSERATKATGDGRVSIFVIYAGARTAALFDPATSRVDITDGPLQGQSFKSPTAAARAVVGRYRPTVSPHRNGWYFWSLDDGHGRLLQSIRPGS